MNSSVEDEPVHHRHGRGRAGVNPKGTDQGVSVDDEGFITDKEIVAGTNGRFIFKHVDFEIMSERGSDTTRPLKMRSESWERLDKYAPI